MTLRDHFSREQREKLAKMIEPPDQDRPVLVDYLISLKQEGEICELISLRRLDSLLPFVDAIRGVVGEDVGLMRIVIMPPTKVQSIRIRDTDGAKSFTLPHEVLDRVARELGLSDGTAPKGLPPLDC